MTQKSLHWDGASVGDADLLTVNAGDGIGYRLANEDYESPLVDRMFRMLWNGDEDRGVLKNWLNELAVTGVATPVAVNTGGAVIYGMPYQNTASVNVAVASPTTDTRQDLIVLRRNWTAQTVRITKIDGIEGGGVPAHTQSPAPSGSGIYDIPLASLSITTGGVITVTDAREYCLFGTGIADDALATAHLNNDSVDFPDRATRTKRLFLGGGDLQPVINAGKWQSSSTTVTWTGAPTWDGSANEEGWQLTGSAYEGIIGAFKPPADYASGTVNTYIWWVANAGIASTFYIRASIQGFMLYPNATDWNYIDSDSTYINETLVANDIYRTEGPSATAGSFFDQSSYYRMWYVAAYWYNAAGAEDINILGIELEYTGYT